MRLPTWARSSDQLKVKYLMSLAALEVSQEGRLSDLAEAAGIKYPTLLWNVQNNVSATVAEAICKVAPGAGIKPHWLTNPAWMTVNMQTGEVSE